MRRSFRPLGAVFRAALLAILDALRVEHAAQDVIADAGQILDAAAADHHHRMFLKVVTFARDVADDFEAIGEPHFGDLAKRRIRLLRRRRIDARAHAALLRAGLQMPRLFAIDLFVPRLADQLTDRRHSLPCLYPVASRPSAATNVNRNGDRIRKRTSAPSARGLPALPEQRTEAEPRSCL